MSLEGWKPVLAKGFTELPYGDLVDLNEVAACLMGKPSHQIELVMKGGARLSFEGDSGRIIRDSLALSVTNSVEDRAKSHRIREAKEVLARELPKVAAVSPLEGHRPCQCFSCLALRAVDAKKPWWRRL